MSPYPITGQCTAFINGIIKDTIGYKNVAEIIRKNNECIIVTKDNKKFKLEINPV